MRYFDLHCDTLTGALHTGRSVVQNEGMHMSVEKGKYLAPYVQCMAVFVPDRFRGEEALAFFDRHADFFESEAKSGAFAVVRGGEDLAALENGPGVGLMLTVEGGAALAGKLENVAHLRERGVRMMTLTWNGSNEIGSGIGSEDTYGLTPFGREVIPEMERAGIAVDISHASERLFWDVAEIAKRPLVASHSNAKTVCGHRRNLTDAQFEAIRKSGGLVGLNYYNAFLRDEPEQASIEDVYAHAEHFLALGGEKTLAMGSDFDGSEMPRGITGVESVEDIANVFLRHNLPESLVDAIFYQNAADFFCRYDGAL